VRVSFESPLGIAIKGKKIGETGKMRLPTGRVDVKIINIQ
jgi:transcription elongation GreA/GreB family factor